MWIVDYSGGFWEMLADEPYGIVLSFQGIIDRLDEPGAPELDRIAWVSDED